MVHQTCCFLGAHNRLVEACSGNASVCMESDNAHLTMRRENTAGTNAAYTTPFLRAKRGNVGHPQCVRVLGFAFASNPGQAHQPSGLFTTDIDAGTARNMPHCPAHRRHRNYLYAQHSCVQPVQRHEHDEH